MRVHPGRLKSQTLVVIGSLILGTCGARAEETKPPLKLNSDILAKGLKLLPRMPSIQLHIVSPVQLGLLGNLQLQVEFRPQTHITIPININSGSRDKELLEEQRRRNFLIAETNALLKESNLYHLRRLDYEKMKQENLLRKPFYDDLPKGKLVVVIADFSSGHPAEGREVADEIAAQLRELQKHGVDIHIIVGEVKPDVVIRNEEMAQDIGKQFPVNTSYVVIWGTMSPRTLGRYRPHITSVQKTADNQGISGSFTIDIDSAELPPTSDQPKYQRECYERLIGATCAAVPSYYAAHEISNDRPPDLSKYLSFLDDKSEEVQQFKEELRLASQWPVLRSRQNLTHVSRISGLSPKAPIPTIIYNKLDDSVMVLITDTKGSPRTFKSRESGKEEFVYIDAAEITSTQFAKSLNAEGGVKEGGGVPWIKLDPEFRDISLDTEKGKYQVAERCERCPVIDVTWFGAKAYCKQFKKDLPTKEEWMAAAEPTEGSFPWGKEEFDIKAPQANVGKLEKYYRSVGLFPKDRSRIGCFDMAGNVSEWCDDVADVNKGQRVVCGGCYEDKPESRTLFLSTSERPVEQVKGQRWVGFRGVLRIPVEK